MISISGRLTAGADGARTAARAAPATVLVVEDDCDIREVLSDTLAIEGYAVVSAANGRQALDLLHAGLDADLILLDLLMPVMNGWEFRAAQRADPALSRIPVVVVSASSPHGLDPERHIAKPFGVDELLSAVAELAAPH
jgi:CheY-like chemotaxis protein